MEFKVKLKSKNIKVTMCVRGNNSTIAMRKAITKVISKQKDF